MENIIDNVLVIKVGTNTLVEKSATGSEQLDEASFRRLGGQILDLQDSGQNVVVVSSAAITAGMVELGLESRSTEISELQRLASIGWRHVLNAWDDALDNRTIGELLLTQRELGFSCERQEALRLTHTLLKYGDLAIANENDAITHKEIAFGDNDTLAATYAAQIGRSLLFGDNVRLVLLSDINGVYEDIGDSDSVIAEITDIDRYQYLAKDSSSQNSTGGMVTKFEAARIANSNGVDMWIANGHMENAIELALSGEIGTHFVAK